MKLYHGTAFDRSFTGNGDIELIGRGEFGKDAFYLSTTYIEAKTRAYLNANQGFGERADMRVIEYELEFDGINVYDFGDFSKEWLEFVFTHKMNQNPDVIIGGLVDEMGRNPGLLNLWIETRAKGVVDDNFTNSIVEQLKTDVKFQIAIKTQKGLDALKFVQSFDV